MSTEFAPQPQPAQTADRLLHAIQNHYTAADLVRRGVCLVNAGQFAPAEVAFLQAKKIGHADRSMASYLAATLVGQQRFDDAADRLEQAIKKNADDPAGRIRHALSLSTAGRAAEAEASLREGIRNDPELAELHFQLGVLLASLERYEEAELRFTQAANIDPEHAEALVNLALCCGVRQATHKAFTHLQRAQRLRPFDPRIGWLLSQAAAAASQNGYPTGIRATMPDDNATADPQGLDELSRVIEAEPDFVDAFLALPVGVVDDRVFHLLLETLHIALERCPEHAELHCHCGRVLSRLGRNYEAISANERAVRINPKCVRALIELGKLYQQTDRTGDAATRVEQAIRAGAEYADIYFLLGNLYRDQGHVQMARTAYRHALFLNERYEAASRALAALPVA